MEEVVQNIFKMFVSSIDVLSSAPNEQISYLNDTLGGAFVDELALDFEYVFGLIDQLLLESLISQEIYDICAVIDKKMEDMSGENYLALWRTDALLNSDKWEEIRILATKAKELMKCE